MIYTIPSSVIYGERKYDIVNQVIHDLNLKKILVITDRGLIELGLVDKVLSQIKLENYLIESDVMPNPSDDYVNEVSDKFKSSNIDAIIAIGGGSVIDAAKAVNILLCNEGSISEFEKEPAKKDGLKLFAFPTTSGTVSEVTSVSVITNSKEKRKKVIQGKYMSAHYDVLDTSLTYDLPKSITVSTGMDALTHAIEALYTYLKDLDTELEIPALNDFVQETDFEIIAENALKQPSIYMNPKIITKEAITDILRSTF